MENTEKYQEHTFKYTTEVAQTSKGFWYVKSIKVRDDALKDLDTALGIAVEKSLELLKRLNSL
jgi:hypothetical protein|tara:strand:- start:39587 stop:39775 length:189 start_codon:yes stop_codon:yes gene_type:complete